MAIQLHSIDGTAARVWNMLGEAVARIFVGTPASHVSHCDELRSIGYSQSGIARLVESEFSATR